MEILTIAVIGAGRIASELACLSSLAGYQTIVEDVLPSALRRAEQDIRSHLDLLGRSQKLTAHDISSALTKIQFAGSVIEAVRDADLVIEALPDELESKIEIFSQLDRFCPPRTLFVSTTKFFDISEIAGVTYRAPQCAGLKTDPSDGVLRIMRGEETSDETIRTLSTFGQKLGRKVLVTEENPTAA